MSKFVEESFQKFFSLFYFAFERVHGMPEWVFSLGGGEGSALGTGGMKTKLNAAKICDEQGCDTVIANGENPELLYDILENKESGYTRFVSEKKA